MTRHSSIRGASPVSLLAAAVATTVFTSAIAAEPPGVPIEGTTIAQPAVTPHQYIGDLSRLPAPTNAPSGFKIYRSRLTPPPLEKAAPPGTPAAPVGLPPGPRAPMPGTIQNFAGLNFNDACTGGQCGGGWPPDTNGDVGPNHYIEAVNTAYAIYNKTGTRLAAFTENNLWLGAGSTPCSGNSDGDPVVLYDWLADRWVLTHFAFGVSGGNPVSPFYQCIAVSKTSDPVAGGWWLYALRMDPGGAGQPPVGALNDYGKFGLWHDCLYMAANEFAMPAGSFVGTAYASFSRSDMYSGSPLTWSLGYIANASTPFTMIPSTNLGTGSSAAQPGTPNYFVSESTSAFNYEVRKFTSGPNCGAGGTLSAPTTVSQASYTFQSGNIVPQPGTATRLDMIDDRLMQKVPYRRIGGNESLWVTHSVGAAGGNTAMQWAQINVTGGTVAAAPVQQGIHAPDSSLYRFMGSLAVDAQGNMALGYSTSGSANPNYPSIAYAGRLAGDVLNTLPQTEAQLVAGAGSQTNNCGGAACDRWGDYSAMSVDPVDNCTFWYVNQYYSSIANGAAGNWQTRIGSFKFPSCALASTTTTLGTSQSPSTAGSSVTYTATVTGATPTGGVAFTDGGATIAGCSAVALTGGGSSPTAQCASGALVGGSHSIVATYGGDGANLGSTSSTLSQVVNRLTSTTGVASSANPSIFSQSVTFTATVTGFQPNGTVGFTSGGATIAGCGTVSLVGSGDSRTAQCSTAALTAAAHAIVATYAGDVSNTGSTSPTLTQTVTVAPTTTTVASSANPSTFSQSVTFTATVSGVAPTGNVGFTSDGATIGGCGAVALSGSGNSRTAQCASAALTAASHSIVATYAGDAGNAGSVSAPLTQVVNPPLTASTTEVASSANPAFAGTNLVFTATVTGAAPTGSVGFTSDGAAIGSCTAVALGGTGNTRTAQCAATGFMPGTRAIVASYAGDSSNTPSVSSVLPQLINASTKIVRKRDFNADGRYDLTWRNSATGQSAVWWMNGITYSVYAVVSSDPAQTITHTGDLNGDGWTDLVFRSAGGTTSVSLVPPILTPIFTDPSWQVTNVGDFDGDGRADLVWRNTVTGQTAIWLMSGTSKTAAAVIFSDPIWQVTHVGDFDGDGRSDLVWRNASSGQTAIWLMNGLASGATAVVFADPNWQVAHVSDFDGDDKSDLVWRNASTGQTAIWLMSGLSATGAGVILADPNWAVTNVGDFDGNGKGDLAWRNSSTGATALWLMNGLASAGAAVVLADPNYRVTHVGDTNADGRSDLVWRNSATGATTIWLMNGLAYSSYGTPLVDLNWQVLPADGL